MPNESALPILISYSHDSGEHRKRVLGLAERLRRDGYDARIDQYVNGTPAEGWPRWMLNQLDAAAFVLCVCTPTYYRRFRGHEEPGQGSGVDWEGAIITQEIYHARSRTVKFVPVLFDRGERGSIPEPMRAATHYTLDSQESYDTLCAFLDSASGVEPHPVGPRKPRERRRGSPLTFAGAQSGRPNNLPHESLGSLFKGRDEVLTELHRRLTPSFNPEPTATALSGQTAIIAKQAIHGLGGVGKTRLAIEYAWRHEAEFAALLFAVAETPEALAANLAGLAVVLALPEREAPEQQVRSDAVLDWLERTRGWLLILDNVDDAAAAVAVERLAPRLRSGRLVITSRRSNWSATIRTLELDTLDPDDAKVFLLERTDERRRRMAGDDAEALGLAQDLGGLALALEQAGAYVSVHRCSLADYRSLWQRNERNGREWFDEQLMHYPRSVAVTWLTSFEKLAEPAQALLRTLAWLSPEPTPRGLLDHKSQVQTDIAPVIPATAGIQPLPELRGLVPAYDYDLAVAQLAEHSLLKVDGESFSVHRLVQEVTRERTPESERRGWLERALKLVNKFTPTDSFDVRTWPIWEPLRPHVSAVIEHAVEHHVDQPTTWLMNGLALFLAERCVFPEAESLYRRALAIGEQSFGPEHPEVAIYLNNLAQLLKDTNRPAEAEPLMRRALETTEQSFGPDHASVAIRLNNLSVFLQDTNRLAEAEPLMRRALAIDEQSFGPQHPDVARDLNNLAQLLKDTNRLAEAEPLMTRVVTVFEKAYGENHPNVATALNNLALLLQDTNRLAEAEPLMRRALAIGEQSYGPEHPEVAIDLNNLATLLRATKRRAEAEPLMRRALAIFVTSLGNEHPWTITARRNYEILLQELKQ